MVMDGGMNAISRRNPLKISNSLIMHLLGRLIASIGGMVVMVAMENAS